MVTKEAFQKLASTPWGSSMLAGILERRAAEVSKGNHLGAKPFRAA